jgi:hypothetical protein
MVRCRMPTIFGSSPVYSNFLSDFWGGGYAQRKRAAAAAEIPTLTQYYRIYTAKMKNNWECRFGWPSTSKKQRARLRDAAFHLPFAIAFSILISFFKVYIFFSVLHAYMIAPCWNIGNPSCYGYVIKKERNICMYPYGQTKFWWIHVFMKCKTLTSNTQYAKSKYRNFDIWYPVISTYILIHYITIYNWPCPIKLLTDYNN